MDEKKKNRSVLRSQKMLKDGFMELMQQKPIQQITVKELCDYVDLNRGTFYLHYKDIYDLLDHIESEILEQFNEMIHAYSPEEVNGKPSLLLKSIFHFLGDNSDFCRMVLGVNRDRNFINKLKTVLKEKCFSDWEYLYSNRASDLYETFYAFMLSGCIGVIENWLNSDNTSQTADEIAELTEKIILHGMQVFSK